MAKRDPYVRTPDAPRRIEIVSLCRDCRDSFIERPEDHSQGYCPACAEGPSSGYVPAWDHGDDYFH